MTKIIVIIIISLFAVASFIISFLQFKEKSFLFNNAYLWASAEERKRIVVGLFLSFVLLLLSQSFMLLYLRAKQNEG